MTEQVVDEPVNDEIPAEQPPVVPPAEDALTPNQPAEPAQTPETTPETVEPPVDTPAPAEYTKYDDDSANAAVNILAEAGVLADEASKYFEVAIAENDPSKIDLAGLTEKIGKDKATAVMLLAKEYYTKQMGQQQKVFNDVVSVVGSTENLAQIQAWVKASGNKEAQQVLDLLRDTVDSDTSGYMSKLIAKDLRDRYDADPKNTKLNISIVQADRAMAPAASLEPISRAEYVEGLKQAYDNKDMAKVAELQARRNLTRNKTN
jgi:hypothetical protein